MELLRSIWEKYVKYLAHKRIQLMVAIVIILSVWNKNFFIEEFSIVKQKPIPVLSKGGRC